MKKNTLHRILSLFLVLIMLAGSGIIPVSKNVKASDGTTEAAVPSTEDDSSEASSNGITQQLVYYWHKGLPPMDGNEYPVLLVWDDKYFLEVDTEFMKYLYRAEYGKNNAYWVTDPGGPRTNGGNESNEGWVKGNYSINVGYPSASGHGLLSNLDFDYNVLKSTGTAVTFSLPSVPVMKRVAKETPNKQYGETEEDMADRVMIGLKLSEEIIRTSGYTSIYRSDETNWLAGFRYMDYKVSTDSFLGITYDAVQNRVFRWFLHPINTYTIKDMPSKYSPLKDWTSATPLSTFISKNLDRLAFYVVRSGSKYTFVNRGFRYNVGRISESFDGWNWLRDLINLEANLELGHVGNVFTSFGSRVLTRKKSATGGYRAGDYKTSYKFDFDVYYAEPNLMYFLKSNIVVEDGQTQNLDGPLVIEEGTKIIVQDGGVLSFTDWVVNRGEILVEPGGTMIVQPNTTPAGHTRNCALVGDNMELTAGGRIAVDGNMIVMPGCTVAGAGSYGIQFGSGAQCVNYGSLVSEIWDVRMDYTLENRDEKSRVYIGWSVTDKGYSLTAYPLDQNQSCLGHYRDYTTPARYVVGWVYGKYKSNVSFRSGSSSMGSGQNRGGRVTP